jgi:dethiobiotin synthetase
VGGALVPYNKKRLVIDIAKELRLSVLIVVNNRLGAINQALLTIEAIRKREMEIEGLIFNNMDKRADKKILRDNISIIKRISGEKIFGILSASAIAGNGDNRKFIWISGQEGI